MSEIKLSDFKGQCLDCRIPDLTTMRKKVATWEMNRNNTAHRITWQYTTPEAREKLKRLYTQI